MAFQRISKSKNLPQKHPKTENSKSNVRWHEMKKVQNYN
jgi:hypothetical protein